MSVLAFLHPFILSSLHPVIPSSLHLLRVQQPNDFIMERPTRGDGPATADGVIALPVGDDAASALDDGDQGHQIPVIQNWVGHNVGAAGGD